ncbi:MAG: desulfoferrodoxin [Christensenellaceae bacterium]|jgi:superoxide reductase|nr:desulfoferrodoxin [Christensenellaceae bacterium]
MEFYICEHCGNIVAYVESSGVPIICCGQPMTKLEPNTKEAATEKHIPVVAREGNLVTVTVGSVEHPMLPEHHIAWVALQTKLGNQRKQLPVAGKPTAQFALVAGDEIEAVYAYCNLHGLWKA